jgi:hypothetical protein
MTLVSVQERPDTASASPESLRPRRPSVARRRALVGFWIGFLIVAGAGVAAWLPDNPTHVIGDVGEVFMMTGAAVLGVSIVVLIQEATGVGSE